MADVKISQLGNASSLTGTELVPVVQGGVTVQTTAQDIADLNSATGTVTSVAVSGTDGIQVDSGSPITTSGTIQLGIDKAALLAHINVAEGAEVNVNADWNAVSGDAQILNKPTAVSAFTNDAGYLTSYTETDPIFSAHPAHNITSTNLTEWAAAYNDKINSASFNTADGVLTLTQQDGGSVTVDLDGRYLTSETDSQTLSWNGATGEISISNGNTIDIDGRYLTSYTETDPVVGAVSGIVKANGLGTISAAVAGTDYVAPAAIANMLETSDIGVTVQGYSAVLAGTTASFTTADETKLDGIEAGAEVNVNADWNAVSGDAQILNKPTLATVATTGSYNDLSDKPTIPAAYTNSDVDAHLNTSTAATGEVLSWNGTDYDWTTPPAGYSNSDVDAHLNTSTATTNQVLSWTGTDYDWVDQSGGGGGATTYTGTASSASWSGSGPYTQIVSVSGITSTDTVILDLNLSSAAFGDVEGLQTAYALVYRAVPGTNQITLYATSTPSISFNFYATVI